MTLFQAIILGIVQGLTEFLPISSSAHLVLVPYLLGWNIPINQAFPFDVLVQLGTLVAVIVFFANDLLSIARGFLTAIRNRKPFETQEARQAWFLILATIPAGLLGIFLKDQVESAFLNPSYVAVFLIVTAFLLISGELIGRKIRNTNHFSWIDALVMGIFQAFSIFPGISRSGSTISGGLLRNLDRPTTARFSFLMSIPIMLAAGFLSIFDLLEIPDLSSFLPFLIVGFVVAGFVGYFSIRWLLKFISQSSFFVFSIYCLMLGSATLLLFLYPTSPNNDPEPLITSSAAVTPAPEITESFMVIDRTSSMVWIQDEMNQCAILTRFTNFVVHEVPSPGSDPLTHPLILWYSPEGFSGESVVLGNEALTLVVNPANPVQYLTQTEIVSILNGSLRTWADMGNEVLELWLYANNDDAQTMIQDAFLVNTSPSSFSFIASDPITLRDAIANHPGAIGFLPEQLVDESVRTVSIPETVLQSLSNPVSVLLPSRPTGPFQDWLACLQQLIPN